MSVCVGVCISSCQDHVDKIKIHAIPLVSYQLIIFSVVIISKESSDLRQVDCLVIVP